MHCIEQVVPFTPSAGVLEWVNGTMPLGEYLMGRLVALVLMGLMVHEKSHEYS